MYNKLPGNTRGESFVSDCESERNVNFLTTDVDSCSSAFAKRDWTLRYWGEHDEKDPNTMLSSRSSVSSPMSWLYRSNRAITDCVL